MTTVLRTCAIGTNGRARAFPAVAAMTLATALGAQVAVHLPFTPVPFTLQVLMVLLAGLILSPREAFAAQAAYVGAGCIGVPWFAGMSALTGGGGLLTIGYLAGFTVAAPLVSLATRRHSPLVSALLGVVVIHVLGTSCLGLLLGLPPDRALVLGSLPFLPGDVLKALAAAAAARHLARPA